MSKRCPCRALCVIRRQLAAPLRPLAAHETSTVTLVTALCMTTGGGPTGAMASGCVEPVVGNGLDPWNELIVRPMDKHAGVRYNGQFAGYSCHRFAGC